jgi:c-di-GMP-binding flagellar brake protein YcgR
MPDKRSYRRFAFEKKIDLRFERDPARAIEGRLLEISFTGMGIFLKEGVDTDSLEQTAVVFDLTHTVEKHLVGNGRIVYVRDQKLYGENGYKLGVEFTEASKDVVLSILDRLEAEISAEIRRRNKQSRRDPGEF